MRCFVWRMHFCLLAVLLLVPRLSWAHVGSKDVFEETAAGPYRLFVTIRMPNVIPGVAHVEVRSIGAAITGIDITPLPLTGEASKHPPTADAMQVSTADPAFFTGAVWMMATGSWQIRFNVAGAGGVHSAAVPVPAVAVSTLTMNRGLGIGLALMGVFLVVSMAGVVAAAVREARVAPGIPATPLRRRRGLLAMAGSLMFMGLLIWGGGKWWDVEAADYARHVYHPLATHAELSGNRMDLKIDPYKPENVFGRRSNADFIPDHGHLMHLYAIREPGMDAVFHLHPSLVSPGDFRLDLPSMPPGRYSLYGDIVHANGFPETLVTSVVVPAGITGAMAGPDDASGLAGPVSGPQLGTSFLLPDGYTMVWDAPAVLTASTAYALRFRLLAKDGSAARDMQPYMGMAGHAAFVKTDGSVFAHVHPEGSAAMAAMMLANPGAADSMPDMPGMSGIAHPPDEASDAKANVVEFPYGFPTSGRYRIIVQMKHGSTVETGVFDADVR